MPLLKKNQWLIMGPIIAIVFLFLCFVVKNSLTMRRIFTASRSELLFSCREMIRNYDQYSNEWVNTSSLEEGDKAWDISLESTECLDLRIPAPIRKLKPHYVIVSTNRINIALRSPLRTSILGYSEDDGNPLELEGKHICLTNGLWFWDRR